MQAGRIALDETADLAREEACRLAGRMALEALREGPIFSGIEMSVREMPELLRLRGVARLSGYVVSRTNLSINRRLSAAVCDETGRDPHVEFLKKLPGAVIVEWNEPSEPGRLGGFHARVRTTLENEGGELRKRAGRNKPLTQSLPS